MMCSADWMIDEWRVFGKIAEFRPFQWIEV